MPELTRPTVTLHYEETLEGDRALVFLHGWCDGSASWAATMGDLKASYRCIALDMRGHGKSGQPRDPLSSRQRNAPSWRTYRTNWEFSSPSARRSSSAVDRSGRQQPGECVSLPA